MIYGAYQKKEPCHLEVTGPATIFVALTWLSLVGLHPCRAQLRFARQDKANKFILFGGQQPRFP